MDESNRAERVSDFGRIRRRMFESTIGSSIIRSPELLLTRAFRETLKSLSLSIGGERSLPVRLRWRYR